MIPPSRQKHKDKRKMMMTTKAKPELDVETRNNIIDDSISEMLDTISCLYNRIERARTLSYIPVDVQMEATDDLNKATELLREAMRLLRVDGATDTVFDVFTDVETYIYGIIDFMDAHTFPSSWGQEV